MKRILLIVLTISLSQSLFSQSPPPPPGIWVWSECDATEPFYQFDLTESYPVHYLYPDYEPSNYIITFYESYADADANINPIANPSNYTNLSDYQIIYAFVEHTTDGNTYINESKIIVERTIVATTPSTLISDCTSSNGIGVFNLSDKWPGVLGGLDPDLYSVSFHETFDDAEQDVNRLSYTYSNTIAYNQTIYAIVHRDQTQCISSPVELDLMVSNNLCQDISVSLYPLESPRPGFNHKIRVYIKNEGPSDIATGSVTFNFDGLMSYLDYDTTYSDLTISQTGQEVSIDFLNIASGVSNNANVEFNLPASVPLGTLLKHNVVYTTNSSDAIGGNDTYNLTEVVIGSYDPNDILESRGEEVIIDDFSTADYLYYTIRFQNVGTAEAINVHIDNTLDSQLDLSTLKMLNSSHTYSFLRTGRELTWTFDDINLPSESMDEPNSHGFVHYRIKPNSGYAIDDVIPNSGEIYFDFNAPVITNTFETKFVEKLLSQEDFEQSDFKMQPNPASNILNFSFENSNLLDINISVKDISGKIVLESANTSTINVSGLDSGMYFATVDLGNNQITKKLIVR